MALYLLGCVLIQVHVQLSLTRLGEVMVDDFLNEVGSERVGLRWVMVILCLLIFSIAHLKVKSWGVEVFFVISDKSSQTGLILLQKKNLCAESCSGWGQR